MFDESDGEGPEEPDAHEFYDFDFDQGLVISDNEAEAHVTFKRRRLWQKTSPKGTGYPMTALATLASYRIARAKSKQLKRAQRLEKKIAWDAAVRLLAMQPNIVRNDFAPGPIAEVSGEAKPLMVPHASHEIQTLPREQGIIFCKCGNAWLENTKMKSIAEPCEGFKLGNRS